eukprot:403364745
MDGLKAKITGLALFFLKDVNANCGDGDVDEDEECDINASGCKDCQVQDGYTCTNKIVLNLFQFEINIEQSLQWRIFHISHRQLQAWLLFWQRLML